MLPGRQERGRDGPLPGQALRRLVPLRPPRHARPGLPRRHPGRSRRRRRGPGQLGQRDPPHVHRALRATPRRAARPPVVTVAPPPSRTRPPLPLPATTTPRSLSAAGVLGTVTFISGA